MKRENKAAISVAIVGILSLIFIPKCVSYEEESAVNHPKKTIKCGTYQGIREIPKSFLQKKRKVILFVFDGENTPTELKFNWFIMGHDQPLKVIKEATIEDRICLTTTPGWIIKANKEN